MVYIGSAKYVLVVLITGVVKLLPFESIELVSKLLYQFTVDPDDGVAESVKVPAPHLDAPIVFNI